MSKGVFTCTRKHCSRTGPYDTTGSACLFDSSMTDISLLFGMKYISTGMLPRGDRLAQVTQFRLGRGSSVVLEWHASDACPETIYLASYTARLPGLLRGISTAKLRRRVALTPFLGTRGNQPGAINAVAFDPQPRLHVKYGRTNCVRIRDLVETRERYKTHVTSYGRRCSARSSCALLYRRTLPHSYAQECNHRGRCRPPFPCP